MIIDHMLQSNRFLDYQNAIKMHVTVRTHNLHKIIKTQKGHLTKKIRIPMNKSFIERLTSNDRRLLG